MLRQRVDLAVLDDLHDLVLDRRADPRQVLGPAVQRQLRDRARRLAHACGGAAVGDHAEAGLAFELQDVGQQLQLGGHIRVPGQRRSHAGDDTALDADDGVPPHVQRAREPGADGARARRPRRAGARDRRQLPGRHGRARRPARSGARLRRRAAPAAQGGPRAGVRGRLPPGARVRGGADPGDGLRLLARPGRRAAADRGGGGRRRSLARLALRAGRERRELGPRPARDLRGRLALCADDPGESRSRI